MAEMFDRAKLRYLLEHWQRDSRVTGDIGMIDELMAELTQFINSVVEFHLTDEVAIEHLQRSGWMQRHEELLTVDSAAALVNRIMRDGNKQISINIYPWEDAKE